MSITYVVGDATEPIGDGPKIITHVCNDIGGWGRGFVLALSAKWDLPEREYRAWAKTGRMFSLGQVQFVPVGDNITVANIIGQRDVVPFHGQAPVRYAAIRRALRVVRHQAQDTGATVHMPRMGCGLAGGFWNVMEEIVTAELVDRGVSVTVYDLE